MYLIKFFLIIAYHQTTIHMAMTAIFRTKNKILDRLMVKAALMESKSNAASASATYNAGRYSPSWFVRMALRHYNKHLDFFIVGEQKLMPMDSIHITKENAIILKRVLTRASVNSDELPAFIQLENQLEKTI